MARFLPGAVIADIRGSIGGNTFSRARSGNTIRSRTTCVNPRSAPQANTRSNLSRVSQAWRTMSLSNIDAWNYQASLWPVTDKFGRVRYPSGAELFNLLNGNLVQNNSPINFSPPYAGGAVQTVCTSVFADGGAQTVNVEFNENFTTDTFFTVSATPPLSPGISSVKSLYKKFVIDYPSTGDVFSVGSNYLSVYPLGLITGQIIFFKVQMIMTLNGSPYTPQYFRVLVS